MSDAPGEARQCVVVVRHGETEWSRDGRHTGRTDVPLTDDGRAQATALRGVLREWHFAAVLSSPMQRALETCRLAGFGDVAVEDRDLREWDYGDYEGRTTAEIRGERPGWMLFRDGVAGGETIEQVGARADRVLARIRAAGGDVLVFAHGHVLRILTARWLEMPASAGQHFLLQPASPSVLGYEHEWTVIRSWNTGTSR